MAGLSSAILVSSLLLASLSLASGKGRVPAMFVFGDSLLDPGNNNNLVSLARANFPPNGIDFTAGATGRFCNGGTIADHLGTLLGLPLIPPFNSPTTGGSRILQGVNFASAGAGILNDTGEIYVKVFPMDEQIQNFKKIREELSALVGENIKEFLGKSLFFICMGNNDYVSNYMLPISVAALKYTPEQYNQMLIQEYSGQLQELYSLGGRKFFIGGVGPLGCMPLQIGYSASVTDKCVESANDLALGFNTKLKEMLNSLNANLQGANFLYGDSYANALEIIDNYSKYGFKYPHTACCGVGKSNGQMICLPVLPLECHDRSEFVFWDFAHPTDAFNATND